MKHFWSLIILLCYIITSCSNNGLSTEDKETCLQTLNFYADVDSAAMKQGFELYRLMLEQSDSINPDDINWYRNNVAHIDSVIHTAKSLIDKDNLKQLVELLEPECINFYGHPNNNIDTELALHRMLVLLYDYVCPKDDNSEYYAKTIQLAEYSQLHMQAVLPKDSELYLNFLQELHDLYEAAGRADDAEKIKKEYDEIIQEDLEE